MSNLYPATGIPKYLKGIAPKENPIIASTGWRSSTPAIKEKPDLDRLGRRTEHSPNVASLSIIILIDEASSFQKITKSSSKQKCVIKFS